MVKLVGIYSDWSTLRNTEATVMHNSPGLVELFIDCNISSSWRDRLKGEVNSLHEWEAPPSSALCLFLFFLIFPLLFLSRESRRRLSEDRAPRRRRRISNRCAERRRGRRDEQEQHVGGAGGKAEGVVEECNVGGRREEMDEGTVGEGEERGG